MTDTPLENDIHDVLISPASQIRLDLLETINNQQ